MRAFTIFSISMTIGAVALGIVGCKPTAMDETTTASATAHETLASPVVDKPSSGVTTSDDAASDEAVAKKPAEAIAPISLSLTPGDPESKLAPRYSPPGKGLSLTAVKTSTELGVDGLQTEVQLGSPLEKVTPVKLLVTRAAADAPYSKLYFDLDGDGKFNEPAVEAKMSDSRGMTWSNFNAVLKASYVGAQTVTQDYPVVFWLTVAKPEDKPDVLRISRRGFKSGEVTVGDEKSIVILSDSNNDAIFGEGDWWELRSTSEAAKGAMRNVGDFAWLGNKAFKLEVENAQGNTAKLVPFDPGMTPEEDSIKRDPYGADRAAARAEKPLEFRHDVDAAIAEAAEKKLPCFIKFETTWCGPCKTMTQYVFTAKDVVDASAGIICVKVDGDERKDLVERFAVKGYPTGVMLSAGGEEAGRFLGYQRVVEMTAFLKEKR